MYSFAGVPLTPSVALHLIERCCVGKTEHRSDIIKTIHRHHMDNGGIPAKTNIVSTVKKALATLQKDKKAHNSTAKGYWTIGLTQQSSIKESSELESESDSESESEQEDFACDTACDIACDTSNADECVYLFWFPSYKKLAIHEKESKWQCKLGRSDRSADIRIKEQCGTALPEKPEIGLVIKTSQSVELEKALHSILTLRKQHIKDISGKEWFTTNPEEVQQLYDWLMNLEP